VISTKTVMLDKAVLISTPRPTWVSFFLGHCSVNETQGGTIHSQLSRYCDE